MVGTLLIRPCQGAMNTLDRFTGPSSIQLPGIGFVQLSRRYWTQAIHVMSSSIILNITQMMSGRVFLFNRYLTRGIHGTRMVRP